MTCPCGHGCPCAASRLEPQYDYIEAAGAAIRRHVELQRRADLIRGRTIEDVTVTDLGMLLSLGGKPGVDGGIALLWRS